MKEEQNRQKFETEKSWQAAALDQFSEDRARYSLKGKLRGVKKGQSCDSNFINRIDSQFFVDKSMLIAKIIDLEVVVFLQIKPRMFGKTMNLHMLRTFFQNKEYIKKKPSKQEVLQLFAGGRQKINIMQQQWVTQPLAIAKDKGWNAVYSKHLCAYPVIYMSWKNIRCSTHQGVIEAIQFLMMMLFDQHSYLKEKVEKGPKQWLNIFNRLSKRESSYTQLEMSLKFLCELLNNYYKKQVIILIDEYDVPFNCFLFQELMEADPKTRAAIRAEREKVQQFLGNLLSAVLKDNQYLYKVVLNGIFDCLMKTFGSGIKDYVPFKVNSIQLSQFYGFSQEQIREQLIKKMLKQTKTPQASLIIDRMLKTIKEWYNGYVVYSDDGKRKHTFCNPYNVMRYLGDCIADERIREGRRDWYLKGSSQKLRFFIFSVAERQIQSLISLNITTPTKFKYSPDINLALVQDLKKIKEEHLSLLLLDYGYLTGRTDGIQGVFSAVIPNRSIEITIKRTFMQWVKKCNVFSFISNTPVNLESRVDYKRIMEESIVSAREVIKNVNQKSFTFILASTYARSLDPTHNVKMEFSSGSGVIGHLYTPFYQIRPVFIHQFKLELRSAWQEVRYFQALMQIYRNNYFEAPLKEAVEYSKTPDFILRPIVIVKNPQNAEQFTLFMDQGQDISHTFVQVQVLSRDPDFLKQIAPEQRYQKQNFDLQQEKIGFNQKLKQYIAEHFDFKQVLEKLSAQISVFHKKRPASEHFSSNMSNPCWQFSQDFVEIEDSYSQILQRQFPDSISLYYCTVGALSKIMKNDEIARKINNAIQEMKGDLNYYLKPMRINKGKKMQIQKKQTKQAGLVVWGEGEKGELR